MNARERAALHTLAVLLLDLSKTQREITNRKQMLRFHKLCSAFVAGLGADLAVLVDFVAGSGDQIAVDAAAHDIDEALRVPRRSLPDNWPVRQSEPLDSDYARRLDAEAERKRDREKAKLLRKIAEELER